MNNLTDYECMGFTHHKTKRSQKIYNCERIDHAKIYSLRGFFFPSLVLQMRGNYSRALCHDSLQ